MHAERTAPLSYRGLNRSGDAIVGVGNAGESAATLARRLFERGAWDLTILDPDGSTVGGIHLKQDGHRAWWGEETP